MLVALRWMSQGGRSRHSLTLLLCTDCTAVWAPPLSDRVTDLGPISPTCVLPLMDNSALMYYVFHIVRSRIKLCKISYSKSVIPAGSDYSQPAGWEVISPFTTSELAGVVKVFLFFPAFTSPRAPLRILIGISYPSPTAAAAPSTHEVLPACRGALAPALVVQGWAATGLRSLQPVRATVNAGARVRPATGSPVVFATS